MLKKLFRTRNTPKWQDENADIRLQAVQALDANEQATLLSIARNDSSSKVRLCAIKQLTHLAELLNLSASAPNKAEQAQALKSWVTAINNATLTSAFDAEQIITGCVNQQHLAAIIQHSNNTAYVELALAGLRDEEALLALMATSSSGNLWLQAIEKLSSIDALNKASELVKGRDKRSLQLIKQKLAAHKKEADQHAQITAQIQQLVEKSEQLLNGNKPIYLEAELAHLQQLWLNLKEQSDNNSANIIEKNIEQLLAQQHNQKQEQQNAEEDTQKNQQNLLLATQLNALKKDCSDTLTEHESLAEQQNTLKLLQQENSEKKEHKQIIKTIEDVLRIKANYQKQNIAALIHSDHIPHYNLQETKNALKNIGRFIQTLDKANIKPSNDISAGEQRLKTHESQLTKNIKKHEEDLDALLADIDTLLDNNDVEASKKSLNHAKILIANINGDKLKSAKQNLNRLHKRFDSLNDWKAYSINPKRKELCDAMAALIEQEMPVEHRLAKIKTLQQQWKDLGHCEDQKQWQFFKKLADKAYAPCKENFSAQRDQRAFNATQRTTICEQLEKFIEEQSFDKHTKDDWKNIEKLNRNIQQEWNKFSPVEQSLHKKLQQRFSTSTDIIYNKLQDQRVKCHEQLTDLCDKADALLNHESSQQANTDFQQLSLQWKTINAASISHHKQQQELWLRFKNAGDALYQQRQSKQQAEKDQYQENSDQAMSLCEKIESLNSQAKTLTDKDLGDIRTQINTHKQAFNALGSFSKNNSQSIRKRFDEANIAFSAAQKQAQKNGWLAQLSALESFGETCSIAEAQNNASAELIPAGIPKHWVDALNSRFNHNEDDWQQQARIICIDMETLCDKEIPNEDQSLKMTLQMQRLQQNFGQQTPTDFNTNLETLYLRWFQLPCWNKEEHAALQQRFLNSAKT